ncbi:hypothetical protein [uncultured Paludibaculum sp.]|uniref:hypothetical protein n=1 Tax=uncultured Paludibaculum sp. TaxID=1765020 RepID=UPI002AAADDF1|nr:hypothetical protein [uncultured Paludibaculum sp.]
MHAPHHFSQDAGKTVQTDSLQLPVNGHFAFAVPDRFPGTAGIRGSLELAAQGGGVPVLPLRFSPGGAFPTVRAVEQ